MLFSALPELEPLQWIIQFVTYRFITRFPILGGFPYFYLIGPGHNFTPRLLINKTHLYYESELASEAENCLRYSLCQQTLRSIKLWQALRDSTRKNTEKKPIAPWPSNSKPSLILTTIPTMEVIKLYLKNKPQKAFLGTLYRKALPWRFFFVLTATSRSSKLSSSSNYMNLSTIIIEDINITMREWQLEMRLNILYTIDLWDIIYVLNNILCWLKEEI